MTRVVFDLEAPRLYSVEHSSREVTVRFDPSSAARYAETGQGAGDFVPIAAAAISRALPTKS